MAEVESTEAEPSAVVHDLEEGENYEFRVIPVNQAGNGEASQSTPSIFTKSRRGEPTRYILCNALCIPRFTNQYRIRFFTKYDI